MRKKSVLALLAMATFAAAVLVGMGASAALAGEVTGNCGTTDPNAEAPFKGSDNAAENCKGEEPGARVSNGNSWCSFSGQNDNPDEEEAGGRTQNYGHGHGGADPSAEPGPAGGPGQDCNPNNTTFGGPPPRK